MPGHSGRAKLAYECLPDTVAALGTWLDTASTAELNNAAAVIPAARLANMKRMKSA
jgi:hypothetical protein